MSSSTCYSVILSFQVLGHLLYLSRTSSGYKNSFRPFRLSVSSSSSYLYSLIYILWNSAGLFIISIITVIFIIEKILNSLVYLFCSLNIKTSLSSFNKPGNIILVLIPFLILIILFIFFFIISFCSLAIILLIAFIYLT